MDAVDGWDSSTTDRGSERLDLRCSRKTISTSKGCAGGSLQLSTIVCAHNKRTATAVMPSLLLSRRVTSGAARAVRATSKWRNQHQALAGNQVLLSTTVRKSGSFRSRVELDQHHLINRGSMSMTPPVRHLGSCSSGVARPALKPMRSVLYTPGSSRHLYKIRDIACDVSLIDLEVGGVDVL